jgi:hypothetical protein
MARRGENIYKPRTGDGRADISGNAVGRKSSITLPFLGDLFRGQGKLRLFKGTNEARIRDKCKLTVKELLTQWLTQERGNIKESSYESMSQ